MQIISVTLLFLLTGIFSAFADHEIGGELFPKDGMGGKESISMRCNDDEADCTDFVLSVNAPSPGNRAIRYAHFSPEERQVFEEKIVRHVKKEINKDYTSELLEMTEMGMEIGQTTDGVILQVVGGVTVGAVGFAVDVIRTPFTASRLIFRHLNLRQRIESLVQFMIDPSNNGKKKYIDLTYFYFIKNAIYNLPRVKPENNNEESI